MDILPAHLLGMHALCFLACTWLQAVHLMITFTSCRAVKKRSTEREIYKEHPKKKIKMQSGFTRLTYRRMELRVAALVMMALAALAAVDVVDSEEVCRHEVRRAVEAIGALDATC
jgi:hypothetical protein